MGQRLLTADELARELKVRPSTIWRWRRDGWIPAVRISRQVVRYDLEDVVKALKERSPDGDQQEE